jgi:hypothetical protein
MAAKIGKKQQSDADSESYKSANSDRFIPLKPCNYINYLLIL